MANKTIEVNDLDDAAGAGKFSEQTPAIACMSWPTLLPFPETCSDKREARQKNISEKRRLDAVCAELPTQQEYAKASRPKPRRVQSQLKDLPVDIGEQS